MSLSKLRKRRPRRCRFEQMESRRMLTAAPLLTAPVENLISPADETPEEVTAAPGPAQGAPNPTIEVGPQLPADEDRGEPAASGSAVDSSARGSIAGMVHLDTDQDCLFDEDETLLSDVAVHLLNDQGALLATAFTDEMGRYEFSDLEFGEYMVVERQPAGLESGGQNPGSHGGDVSSENVISQIVIDDTQPRVEYNFCELPEGTAIEDPDEVVTNGGELKDNLPSLESPSLEPATIPLAARAEPQPLPYTQPTTPALPAATGRPEYSPVAKASFDIPSYGAAPTVDDEAEVSVVKERPTPRTAQSQTPAAELKVELAAHIDDDNRRWRPAGDVDVAMPEGLTVLRDFDGDGQAELGVLVDGVLFLDVNGNGRFDEGDVWAQLERGDELIADSDEKSGAGQQVAEASSQRVALKPAETTRVDEPADAAAPELDTDVGQLRHDAPHAAAVDEVFANEATDVE